MSSIRPLERTDIPQVAGLYEHLIRSGSWTPPPDLPTFFERTLLDHPWADPAIPSLVYETDAGRILGFIASHVRRLRFGEEQIRMGCSGQLIAHPSVRNQGVGALLLRRYLSGPQELTITDGGTETLRRMWERLGGHTLSLASLDWTRLFSWHIFRIRYERLNIGPIKLRTGPLWSMLDSGTNRLPLSRLEVPPLDRLPFFIPHAGEPSTQAEPLTPAAILQHLPTLTSELRLRPDYDEKFLDWLFQEMAEVRSRGTVTGCLVRDQAERVLGWYVVYLDRGTMCQVLQIVALERDIEAVVRHLFHHALRSGAAALRGRLEPYLFRPPILVNCLITPSERALIHSRNPEIVHAVLSGQAMLTRMDGEWWMGPHIEPFGGGAFQRRANAWT